MSHNKHRLNKHKRDYACGKELSNDLIQLIIGDLEQDYNGNKSTSQVDRGAFSAVANKYKVSVSTVTLHWNRFCFGKELCRSTQISNRPGH